MAISNLEDFLINLTLDESEVYKENRKGKSREVLFDLNKQKFFLLYSRWKRDML